MSIFNRLLGRSTKGSSATARERLQLILVHDRIDLPPAHLEAMKEEILAVIAKYVAIDSGKVDIALHQRDRENMLVAEIPFLKPIESMDIDELVRLPERDSIDSSSLIVDDEESELIGLPSVDSLNMDVLLWEDDTQRNRAITNEDLAAAEVFDGNDAVFKSKASDLASNGYSIFDDAVQYDQSAVSEPEFLDDDTQRNRAITDEDLTASDIVAASMVANEVIESLESSEIDTSYIADTDHGQGRHAENALQSEALDPSNAWSEDPPLAADAEPADMPLEQSSESEPGIGDSEHVSDANNDADTDTTDDQQ